MWAFFFRRVRLFLVIAIVLPVAASVARRLAERIERQSEGATFGSRVLRSIERVAGRARSMLR